MCGCICEKKRIVTCLPTVLDNMKKKIKRKNVPPSSYDTMPYYFPTEQVDNVGKLKLRQAKIRKRKK
jgi:hypothetical protein